jgi:hypothetical protein
MLIGRRINLSCYEQNIVLNGNIIKFVNQVKYLGFVLNDDLSNVDDIKRCRNKFYGIFNILLRKFHYLDLNAFYELFNSYCLQFYGAEMWFSNIKCKTALKKFDVGFHKSFKKNLKCPYYVSTVITLSARYLMH